MESLIENPLTYHALIAAAILAALYVLSRPIRSFFHFVGGKIFARTENVLDDRILEVLTANVRPALLLFGLEVALREVHKGVRPSDQTLQQILEYAGAVLFTLVLLLVMRVVIGVIREVVNWYLDRISGEGAPHLKMTLGPLTNKTIVFLIGMVGAIILLDHFGINIGSLIVSLGVGSLAVALAAQETLANMIAGFVILVDRPFRVGDRIEFAQGQIGDVREIGLRSTRLINFDNNVIIIPNAELVKGRIINYSHPQQEMRVLLRFDLAYGVDTNRVRSLLVELAAAHPQILKDPAPQVFVTALAEAAVQVTLVARCVSFTQQFAVETTLREQAYQAFTANGIALALPQRIVHRRQDA